MIASLFVICCIAIEISFFFILIANDGTLYGTGTNALQIAHKFALVMPALVITFVF